jgi:hypothetical protein
VPSLIKFLNPGSDLWARRAALLTLDYTAKTLVLATLFFSLDHVADVLRPMNPEGILRFVLGVVLMQALLAYVFLCLQGSFADFRIQLKATLRNWRGATIYLVFLPLLMPLGLGAISMAVDRAEFYLPSLRVIEALPSAVARWTSGSAWLYALSMTALLGVLLAAQLQIGRRANAIRQVAQRLQTGTASRRSAGSAIPMRAGTSNIARAVLRPFAILLGGILMWGRRHWLLLIVIGIASGFLLPSLKQMGRFGMMLAGRQNAGPELRINVIYECVQSMSFKVIMCTGMMESAVCELQNYRAGQPYSRGVLNRKKVTDAISSICHLQTPAEAAAHPHGPDLPRNP